jgi:hypothetical protein
MDGDRYFCQRSWKAQNIQYQTTEDIGNDEIWPKGTQKQ